MIYSTEDKRKLFIEMAETMSALAYAQKNWTDEMFIKSFNITKDKALLNNIKVMRGKLFDIDE